ncbi:hypothetical protein GCM10011360_26990 [Primorskyibacter flagellatus]|uniref:YCII-related domain-containing protein n=1 Tax=Primorskyibacter flagellatus TaxID=1387277 RepID=A0A917EI63_9RHOB|nr:hypothetical protein [Primorskyibacter flagellatus]GGE37775.1 hypothetical protein GCM10011360_26990 [Primorskyibacter flagellatus]
MPKFLYVYHADAPIDMSPEDAAVAIEQWGKWMQSLGPALIEPGEPVGLSKLVKRDGVTDTVPNAAFGWSVVEAASIEQACDMAKGNPMVEGGGAVEVAEIMPMPM